MIVTKEQALKMYCCEATDETCVADQCMAWRPVPYSLRIVNARNCGDERTAVEIGDATADQYYCGLVGMPML